jgi:hypothetical protein
MHAMDAILKHRFQGHRDSTYAMLLQLVATDQTPECLRVLEEMAMKCWRDVRGFIRHFEQHGYDGGANAVAIVQGCVRMTNAQIRKDWVTATATATARSLAAKWVPRERKCRGSPLLQWYYDALAADMFPGAPDAKRRYRQLISALSPPTTAVPMNPSLAWFVKRAENAQENAQEINDLWRRHLARHAPVHPGLIPVLSLSHSMGSGHNNCLHAGIGLALHLLHLSPPSSCRILAFSSHAEWHALEGGDFVSHAQQLLRAARAPTNGLNANLTEAIAAIAAIAATAATAATPLLIIIIGDMEHDEPINADAQTRTWNVSRNGRPASFSGDNPRQIISYPDSVYQPHKKGDEAPIF